MNDVINKLTEKIKSPKVLVAAGLAGILLIFLSSFLGGDDNGKKQTPSAESITAEEYRGELEQSVAEIVKSITGSDNVKALNVPMPI